MEKITIEKIIKLDGLIDSIEYLSIKDELKYDFDDDNSHATGKIFIDGSVNTVNGLKEISEEVEVDIYAPFEKQIDKENFKIEVMDYSYKVNNQNLIVYLVLSLDGFKELEIYQENEKEDSVDNSEVIEQINNLNEIKEEVREKKEVNIVKSESVDDHIDNSWATDLFSLSSNNTTFMKVKLNSEKDN